MSILPEGGRAVVERRASTVIEGVSLAQAKERGLRWYFTGLPCAKGHVAKRSVSSRGCRACVDQKRTDERRADPSRLRSKDRQKYWADPDRARQICRDSRARHLEQRRADGRAQYAKNPVPYKARARAWGRAHPEYLKFMVARRRATILHAMPPWLTPEQLEEMRAIYARAPAGHDVDHIIPLRGKTVCGLHVPWNLQYLPTAANRAKGNRHG